MDLVNKYRPTSLKQILGQDTTVASIRGMMKRGDEVNPTTLFCGPHSTGKTTLAWLLAMYANCTNRDGEGEACRECDSCVSAIRAIREGRDTESIIEKPLSDSGVEAIQRLERIAQLRPSRRYRFIILDEVHVLSKQAFEKSKRLFERPPQGTRFILCTTEVHKLDPAFFSRNVVYALDPVTPKVTAEKLLWPVNQQEQFGLDPKTISAIAIHSQGFPRDALNMLAQIAAAKAGGADPTTFPRLIAATEEAKPYIVVKKFCTALFAGNHGNTLATLRHVNAPDYFVDRVLATLALVLNATVNAKLVPPDQVWLLRDVKTPPAPQTAEQGVSLVEDLTKVMNVLLETQARIKTRMHDPHVVLLTGTIDALRIIRKWYA